MGEALGVGHDGGRVGVHEDDLVALLAEGLHGLGAGVVELAGLADDDGAGTEDHDLLYVGALAAGGGGGGRGGGDGSMGLRVGELTVRAANGGGAVVAAAGEEGEAAVVEEEGPCEDPGGDERRTVSGPEERGGSHGGGGGGGGKK